MVEANVCMVQSCVVSYQLDETQKHSHHSGIDIWAKMNILITKSSLQWLWFQCLDEVNITVETCEFERTGAQTPTVQSLAGRQGKYRYDTILLLIIDSTGRVCDLWIRQNLCKQQTLEVERSIFASYLFTQLIRTKLFSICYYSFIHKVIDGITIVVNTVNVNFISPAFTASVQVSQNCCISISVLV